MKKSNFPFDQSIFLRHLQPLATRNSVVRSRVLVTLFAAATNLATVADA